jgi:alpha-L-fucosidase
VINDRFGQMPAVTDPVDDEILAPPAGDYWDFRTPEYTTYADIKPFKWECTRGLGYSFSYNQNERDAHTVPADDLVRMLIDVVSKNGNLLLSFGPMADGSVPLEQRDRLVKLGAWLSVNGEAIYGTRPWQRAEGRTSDGQQIRFTQRNGTLYAILMDVPRSTELSIEDVSVPSDAVLTLLGQPRVLDWRQEGSRLVVSLPPELHSASAYAIRIKMSS